MHVRPVLVVAILAAAASAAVVRLTTGAVSPTFAVSSAAAVPPGGIEDSRRAAGDDPRLTINERTSPISNDGPPSSAADGSSAPRAASSLGRRRVVVFVAGDVRRPGVYTVAGDARVVDALRAAGGATVDADPVAVDLAARVEDGEEIAVPARGAADAASVAGSFDGVGAPQKRHAKRHRRRKRAHRRPSTTAAGNGTTDAETTDARGRVGETVDINRADVATLATLPGIGPGLAERIVDFRDLNGPFASADELLDVGGVTASKLDRFSPSVTFGAPGGPSRPTPGVSR